MALRHFAISCAVAGLLGLAALPAARAADSIEAEATGTTANTADASASSGDSLDHSFHNRSYGSGMHGEIPMKPDPLKIYYYPAREARATPSCKGDGRDSSSRNKVIGYFMGTTTNCPDYRGDVPLQQGTWTNEPLQPASWKERVWTSDARSTGSHSDEYVKGMASYVSTPGNSAAPAPAASGSKH